MDNIRFRCADCGLFVDPGLLSSHACPRSGRPLSGDASYEDNLAVQESLGGSVMKACKDINAAAPVVDSPTIDSCSVCLEPCARVRKARACSHEFCAACMENWLSSHVTCPVCVADLSVHGGHRYVMDAGRTPTVQQPTVQQPVMLSLTLVRPAPPPARQAVLDSIDEVLYHSSRIADILSAAIDQA